MNGTQPGSGPGWSIRPAGSADADALRVFLTGLSLRTRYLRFFAGVLPVTPAFLRWMSGATTASGDVVDALVVTGPGPTGPVLGHGMATDTRDDAGRPVTELGVVVADAHQGRGTGSALIRALIRRAQARGATTVLMEVLAENRVMLAMIGHYCPAARYTRSGPYVSVHVQLPIDQEEPAREPAITVGAGNVARAGPARAGADLSVG